MSVANPYRVVKTVSGQPIKLMPETYPLRRDAEAWAVANRRDWGPKYRVIRGSELPDMLVTIRANSLKAALRQQTYLIASDYDDARDRLLKIATKMERHLAATDWDRPRRGWLQTETGLHHLYDCLFQTAERRRVGEGSYTPEERALLGNRNTPWGQPNAIVADADAEYEHQLKTLAHASLRGEA